MEYLYLILAVILFVFVICSFVGLFRFLCDTHKYSSYYNELKSLKEKAVAQAAAVEDKEEIYEQEVVNDE